MITIECLIFTVAMFTGAGVLGGFLLSRHCYHEEISRAKRDWSKENHDKHGALNQFNEAKILLTRGGGQLHRMRNTLKRISEETKTAAALMKESAKCLEVMSESQQKAYNDTVKESNYYDRYLSTLLDPEEEHADSDVL